jgi:hypothetical protein
LRAIEGAPLAARPMADKLVGGIDKFWSDKEARNRFGGSG